jgi:hypothetical protein
MILIYETPHYFNKLPGILELIWAKMHRNYKKERKSK